VINSSEHLVTNLASGNYEVIIHLNDECDIYLDEVIVDKKAIYIEGTVDCNTISVKATSQNFGDFFCLSKLF